MHNTEFPFVSLRLIYKIVQKERQGKLKSETSTGRPTLFDEESQLNILEFANAAVKKAIELSQESKDGLFKNEIEGKSVRKIPASAEFLDKVEMEELLKRELVASYKRLAIYNLC